MGMSALRSRATVGFLAVLTFAGCNDHDDAAPVYTGPVVPMPPPQTDPKFVPNRGGKVLAGVRFDKERVRPGETIRVTAVPVGGQGDGFSAAVINGIRSAQIDDPVNAVPGEKRYAVTKRPSLNGTRSRAVPTISPSRGGGAAGYPVARNGISTFRSRTRATAIRTSTLPSPIWTETFDEVQVFRDRSRRRVHFWM